MLVAAAVLPHPPLLIPELAAGAADELATVRTACLDALKPVLAANCDVVVVGVADRAHDVRETFAPGAAGSMAGFGVQITAHVPGVGGKDQADRRLPLSLTVGAWLMSRFDEWGRVRSTSLPSELATSGAWELGREIGASADRVAIVAMADGSSTLSLKAPGYLADGAEEWQATVTDAIASVDHEALAAVTAEDASRFGATGRAVWQVLAGAASASGGQWRGEVLAADAPYGVGYVVASWVKQPE